MGSAPITRPLGEGVTLTLISDPKFKSNRLSVYFAVPLAEKTAAPYALLPALWQRGWAGCPDYTAFGRELSALYGASLDGNVTALGDTQLVGLSLSLMDERYALSGEPLTAEGSQLLANCLSAPYLPGGCFEAEGFAVERQNLVEDIEAAINDKRSWARFRCLAEMNAGLPSALRRSGEAAAARALAPEGVTRDWRRLMASANIELFATGALPEAKLEALAALFAEKLLPLRGEHILKPAPTQRRAAPATPRRVTERMPVAQAKLVLGLRAGEFSGERGHAAMQLASALLGGTPTSRFFMNVREKLSLCYYCAGSYTRPTGIYMVDCGVEPANVARAETAVLAEIAAVAAGDFTPDELENARRSLLSAYRSLADSTGALEGYYLRSRLLSLDRSPEREAALLRELTAAEVAAAAATLKLDTVYLLTGEEAAHE